MKTILYVLAFGATLTATPALANRNDKIESFCQCISLDHDKSEMWFVQWDKETGEELVNRYIKGYEGGWALEMCQADIQKEWLCR